MEMAKGPTTNIERMLDLENRRKTAKSLMMTFAYRSTCFFISKLYTEGGGGVKMSRLQGIAGAEYVKMKGER
jgi:hypothetical protein